MGAIMYEYKREVNYLMLTLLPYQQRALDAVQKAIRGSVYIPTGGGKTVVMKRHSGHGHQPQSHSDIFENLKCKPSYDAGTDKGSIRVC